jgi:hypothetical protein
MHMANADNGKTVEEAFTGPAEVPLLSGPAALRDMRRWV